MEPNYNEYFETCIKTYNETLNYYNENKIKIIDLNKIEKIKKILLTLIVKIEKTGNLELIKKCKLKLFEIKFEIINKISEYYPLNDKNNIETYIRSRIIDNEFLINFKDIFLIPLNNFKDFKDLKDLKDLKDYYEKYFRIINYRQNKNILLYGPKGCGKTLISQCFAGIENNIKYIMINNENFFTIEGFSGSFIKIIKLNQPIVIFFKNINKLLSPILNRFNSIIDNLNTIKNNKIYIIASCNHPNEISNETKNKFKIEFIRPVFDLNDKINYIKSLSKLTGIPLNLSEDDYMKVAKSLRYFSNEDMKNLIIYCDSITNNITKDVMINNINNIRFSLNDDILNKYNLH